MLSRTSAEAIGSSAVSIIFRLLLYSLRFFIAVGTEHLTKLLIGRMEGDFAKLCVKVEDAPTFAAAVAPKHIVSDLHIHMSFSICTEWTPTM